jgi:hypothetical protein
VNNENIDLTKESAIAAKWWADRIRHGAKQQMLSPMERAQDTTGAMTELMMVRGNMERKPTPSEHADRFEELLAKAIPDIRGGTKILSVDYSPDLTLSKCYKEATNGASDYCVFPVKTVMWVRPGSVQVRYGYGAETTTLLGDDS